MNNHSCLYTYKYKKLSQHLFILRSGTDKKPFCHFKIREVILNAVSTEPYEYDIDNFLVDLRNHHKTFETTPINYAKDRQISVRESFHAAS